jgi:carotenoid 1,2-hydratase
MTERGRTAARRSPESFRLGPSALRWTGDALTIDIDEIGAPLPRRVRGRIVVRPSVLPATAFALDEAARHVWQPVAPMARIEVALDRPGLNWNGSAYLDSNSGAEPLEQGFKDWTWSRAHMRDGCVVLYDSRMRSGATRSLALHCAGDGTLTERPAIPETALASTGWRIRRSTRADTASDCEIVQTLEDTPFYARSLIRTKLYGEPALAFHESLSLDRFRSPVVKAMLPFRMPRIAGR